MTAQIIELEQNSEEWLKHRQKYMGSSDAPAAMGFSNYRSPVEVARDKKTPRTSDEHSEPETQQQHRGHVLEPLIGRLYELRTGINLTKGKSYIHENGIMAASLDFEGVMDDGDTFIVEAKSHVNWVADQYGDDGDPDAVTDYEYIQCQHQMAVSGHFWGKVAILFGNEETLDLLTKMLEGGSKVDSVAAMVISLGMDFRVFPVYRNNDFIKTLIDAEIEFWNSYVLGDEIPADIKRMTPRDNIRAATEDEQELAANMKIQYTLRKSAEKEYGRLVGQMEQIIGEDAGIETDLGVITFKPRKGQVSWKGVAETCFETMTNEEAEEIKARHTGKDTRVLNVPREWGKDL